MLQFAKPDDFTTKWTALFAAGFVVLAAIFVGTAPKTMSGGPMSGNEAAVGMLGIVIIAVAVSQLQLYPAFDVLLSMLYLSGICSTLLLVVYLVGGQGILTTNSVAAGLGGLFTSSLLTTAIIGLIAGVRFKLSSPKNPGPDEI